MKKIHDIVPVHKKVTRAKFLPSLCEKYREISFEIFITITGTTVRSERVSEQSAFAENKLVCFFVDPPYFLIFQQVFVSIKLTKIINEIKSLDFRWINSSIYICFCCFLNCSFGNSFMCNSSKLSLLL